MKRLATLLLAFAMLLSLVACGETAADNGSTASKSSPASSTDQSASAAPAQEQKDAAKEETKTADEMTFTELVAVDNEECSIKITGIDPDNMWGYTLNAVLENKSTDKTYMFSVVSAAINGVECDPLFADEVAAEKKSNVEINFSDDALKENGITQYTDIELNLRVYDSNDWTANAVAEETIHVYPYGEDKAERFVREAQPDDNVIIDNDSVTVIVTGYEDDAIWGYTAKLFLVNKTDKTVMFSVDEASVNGFMADPFYATSVSPGNCAFSSMSWSDNTLEDNGITSVETIEFKLRAYDTDDLLGDDFANETITLNP